MEGILQWGMDYTMLAVLGLVYWCVDEKKGLRLGIIIAISAWLNLALKSLLDIHFPADILSGLLIGSIILCTYLFAGRRLDALLAEHSPRAGMIACAAIAFAMTLYRPSLDLLMPAGMMLGLGTGYFMCWRNGGFSASAACRRTGAKNFLALLARFMLGLTVTILLYILTGSINDIFMQTGNYQLFVFLRFILIAFWLSAGAPWLFCALRLCVRNN